MWPCTVSGNTGMMNNIALVTCFNFTDCLPQFSCGHGKWLNVFLYINDALSVQRYATGAGAKFSQPIDHSSGCGLLAVNQQARQTS